MAGLISLAFLGNMVGAAEVPPVQTIGSGTGLVTVSPDISELSSQLQVSFLNGVTAAHIHLGQPGENGPIVLFLFGPSRPVDLGGMAMLPSVTATAADLVGPLAGQPLSTLVQQILAGNSYVNVHTVRNPGGEIRSQLAPALTQ